MTDDTVLASTARLYGVVNIFTRDDDNWGRKLHDALQSGKAKQAHSELWAKAVQSCQPPTCVDVGANYGHVSLTTRYSDDQRLTLIEASPFLVPALKASIETHQDRDRMKLVERCAGPEDGQAKFNVDRKWSGSSSAFFKRKDSPFKGEGEQKFDTVEVAVSRLDDIVSARGGGVLIKIDVEGGELGVLRGSTDLLARADWYLIILEFHKPNIGRTGEKPEDWFDYIQGLGDVYYIGKGRLSQVHGYGGIVEGKKYDLVVVNHKGTAPLQELIARYR